jgi:thymidine phosphorylase
MVAIGTRAGVRTEAVISAMDAPLGRSVGNALEIIECIEVLKGRGPADVTELVVALASRMLVVGGAAADAAAEGVVREALQSGRALEKLRALIAAQGGDAAVVDDYGRLAGAAHRRAVAAPRSGFLTELHADLVGRASAALGAGRARLDDTIDYGAGVLLHRKPGEAVSAGEPILDLLYNHAGGLEDAVALAGQAIVIAPEPRRVGPLVLGSVR